MPATHRCCWLGPSSWFSPARASLPAVPWSRWPAHRARTGRAGTGSSGSLPSPPAQDGGLELEDLFVDPDWRRRGIARHLVRQVVNTARDTGHRRLWVTGNLHALAFYLAVGFIQVDQVPTALGTALRMSLDLNLT